VDSKNGFFMRFAESSADAVMPDAAKHRSMHVVFRQVFMGCCFIDFMVVAIDGFRVAPIFILNRTF
jgi:hypothetical protein